MATALDDAAMLHDENQVGLLDGRQAMRDHQRGAMGEQAGERALDEALGFAVEG